MTGAFWAEAASVEAATASVKRSSYTILPALAVAGCFRLFQAVAGYCRLLE